MQGLFAFLQNLFDLTNIDPVKVAIFVIGKQACIDKAIRFQHIRIEFTQDEDCFRLLIIDGTTFVQYGGQTALFGFIPLSTAMRTAVVQGGAMLLFQKAGGHRITVFRKLIGVALRANEKISDGFIPKDTDATPGSGHRIAFFRAAVVEEFGPEVFTPALADRVRTYFEQLIPLYDYFNRFKV